MSNLHRIWDLGQQHLAAGRYQTARQLLERAESIAWRDHDAASLARIYLPLLEARRLIRYRAAEGLIWIGSWQDPPAAIRRAMKSILDSDAATCLLAAGAGGHLHNPLPETLKLAGQLQHAARRTGRSLEALLLLQHRNETRLCTTADPTFAAGLPVQWLNNDGSPTLGESTNPNLTIPLPTPNIYTGSNPGPGATARESLLLAWEALALKWQHHHPPPRSQNPWHELAWLRLAQRIDPACEPVLMRMMALSEAIERQSTR